jgi:hypothetical protein
VLGGFGIVVIDVDADTVDGLSGDSTGDRVERDPVLALTVVAVCLRY